MSSDTTKPDVAAAIEALGGAEKARQTIKTVCRGAGAGFFYIPKIQTLALAALDAHDPEHDAKVEAWRAEARQTLACSVHGVDLPGVFMVDEGQVDQAVELMRRPAPSDPQPAGLVERANRLDEGFGTEAGKRPEPPEWPASLFRDLANAPVAEPRKVEVPTRVRNWARNTNDKGQNNCRKAVAKWILSVMSPDPAPQSPPASGRLVEAARDLYEAVADETVDGDGELGYRQIRQEHERLREALEAEKARGPKEHICMANVFNRDGDRETCSQTIPCDSHGDSESSEPIPKWKANSNLRKALAAKDAEIEGLKGDVRKAEEAYEKANFSARRFCSGDDYNAERLGDAVGTIAGCLTYNRSSEEGAAKHYLYEVASKIRRKQTKEPLRPSQAEYDELAKQLAAKDAEIKKLKKQLHAARDACCRADNASGLGHGEIDVAEWIVARSASDSNLIRGLRMDLGNAMDALKNAGVEAGTVAGGVRCLAERLDVNEKAWRISIGSALGNWAGESDDMQYLAGRIDYLKASSGCEKLKALRKEVQDAYDRANAIDTTSSTQQVRSSTDGRAWALFGVLGQIDRLLAEQPEPEEGVGMVDREEDAPAEDRDHVLDEWLAEYEQKATPFTGTFITREQRALAELCRRAKAGGAS